MAETVKLKVEPRTGSGSQEARRLRRKGLLPAVLYGHKQDTVALALSRDEFEKAVHKGARTVELEGSGQNEQALIQEIQWDYLGKDVLHVDFRRVSKDERVVLSVPLHIRGVAPGVTAGGVLDQPLHTLEIECLATAVPDSIRVNIGELQLDGFIYVKDLQLPAGVKAMVDADQVVVHVKPPQAEVEPTAAGEAGQAEPEVIGRKAAEEGEEEK